MKALQRASDPTTDWTSPQRKITGRDVRKVAPGRRGAGPGSPKDGPGACSRRPLLVGMLKTQRGGLMSLARVSVGRLAVVVTLGLAGGPVNADPKAPSAGQKIYDRECATCHGAEGKGDGETAVYVTPQPQDLTTGILKKRSDEFLTTIITKGGVAKGLSESMPAFPKLSKSEVQSVVVYLRQLGGGGPKKTK